MIRDYKPEDFEAIQRIHEQTGIDYCMPDINSPLFLVTKVLEVEKIVRAALGMYIQCEAYLWLDKSDWASPEEKFQAIKELDKETMDASWLKGIDCCVLYLPPGMDRFGKRLEQDFGFTRPREGWLAFSKSIGEKQ